MTAQLLSRFTGNPEQYRGKPRIGGMRIRVSEMLDTPTATLRQDYVTNEY
jgi:uncharacterized protein (DUF433 family)